MSNRTIRKLFRTILMGAGMFLFLWGLGGKVAHALTVTSPNGGEIWVVESVHDITWSGGGLGPFTIQYSTNSGATWLPVARWVHGNSYPWTIPNTPSQNCRVKVYTGPPGESDISDNDFTITSGEITVTDPNDGEENWGVGVTHYITWTSQYYTDSVKIQYSTNSGSSWLPVKDTTSNDGTYEWITPNTPSANCRVKVSDYKDGDPSDISDNNFVISRITVLSPNGGEYWCVDSTRNITWNSNFYVDNVKLEYSTNSGGTWLTIINSTENDGIYQWTVSNNSLYKL